MISDIYIHLNLKMSYVVVIRYCLSGAFSLKIAQFNWQTISFDKCLLNNYFYLPLFRLSRINQFESPWLLWYGIGLPTLRFFPRWKWTSVHTKYLTASYFCFALNRKDSHQKYKVFQYFWVYLMWPLVITSEQELVRIFTLLLRKSYKSLMRRYFQSRCILLFS